MRVHVIGAWIFPLLSYISSFYQEIVGAEETETLCSQSK